MIDDDLRGKVTVSFYRSSGPGGQRKNKKATAVRLRHTITGVTAIATEHRNQSDNLELAFRRLREKLKQLYKRPKPRLATHASLGSVNKRLEKKKIHSQKKSSRKRFGLTEELD